ncbi:MAG: acyl carrier protein [Ferruginibacter sp.]|nr:acyl carrier protein [Ferruginibacter sp.]
MDRVQTEINESIFAVKKIPAPAGNALLKEDLGIDSMQFIRIISKLTGKLDVNIFELSDQDLAGVKTVDQLADLFRKK